MDHRIRCHPNLLPEADTVVRVEVGHTEECLGDRGVSWRDGEKKLEKEGRS